MRTSGYLIYLFVVVVYLACRSDTRETTEYLHLRGETMGTTYTISYASYGVDYQLSVDSLLREVNMSLSTYIPESTISKFNESGEVRITGAAQAEDSEQFSLLRHFQENLRVAGIINHLSDGAFDPTVAPLVNLWGFGWEGRAPSSPDSAQIDSILQLVGMHHIYGAPEGQERVVRMDKPGVKLDFSALAKGYGVDIVSEFFISKGVSNFFVEIGGEVRTGGLSPRGDRWRVGINQPDPESDASELYTRISVSNTSMATSGNYRNFYFIDSVRVWHTINPKTGYPENNPMLSATVVYKKCIIADALATACMVMGPEKGLKLVTDFAAAEALILYQNQEGQIAELMTPGFKELFIDLE